MTYVCMEITLIHKHDMYSWITLRTLNLKQSFILYLTNQAHLCLNHKTTVPHLFSAPFHSWSGYICTHIFTRNLQHKEISMNIKLDQWSHYGNINSLWPSDAISQHRSGSTLAQVMAWNLMAPILTSHQWRSFEGNFTWLKLAGKLLVWSFSQISQSPMS